MLDRSFKELLDLIFLMNHLLDFYTLFQRLLCVYRMTRKYRFVTFLGLIVIFLYCWTESVLHEIIWSLTTDWRIQSVPNSSFQHYQAVEGVGKHPEAI